MLLQFPVLICSSWGFPASFIWLLSQSALLITPLASSDVCSSPFLPFVSSPPLHPSLLTGLLLSVYLCEQHELGELPRQHEAQSRDAQSKHGRPARVASPGARERQRRGGGGEIMKSWESIWAEEIRKAALRCQRTHKHSHTGAPVRSHHYKKLIPPRCQKQTCSLVVEQFPDGSHTHELHDTTR